MYYLLAALTEYSAPVVDHLIFNYGRFGIHYCLDQTIPFNFFPFYNYIEMVEKDKEDNNLVSLIY